ncbi:TMEM165/GDT1 family protein [Clostridiaceae bacterium 35-E11]
MLQELSKSLLLIFMAEMGDKTQILAMAFATQFPISKVLIGILIGVILNHGIAVILGAYLSNVIPINMIQIIAGFLFIGFALWTLKEDEEEEEESAIKRFGPVLTVATAFFIGELGDKTQLAAITLAADARAPIFILIGTVSGMVLTSALGIFVGSKIGDKIPAFTIKIGSAGIFMLFGLGKLYTSVPSIYITPINIVILLSIISISVYIIIKPTLKARKQGKKSVLQEVAATLYEHAYQIQESVKAICLGEVHCGRCQGKQCMIGYAKKIMQDAVQKGEYVFSEDEKDLTEKLRRSFEEKKVIDSLSMVIDYLTNHIGEYDEDFVINKVRQVLETILFQQSFEFDGDIKQYIKRLRKKDKRAAQEIERRIKEIGV